MQAIGDLLKKKNLSIQTLEIEPRFKRVGWTAMSNKIIFHKRLSVGAKTMYWYLFARCFQKDNCFPGVERIANELNISRPTAINYIKELANENLMKKKRRGMGKTNVYILRF